MENQQIRLKCYKCGGQFLSNEMRYDPDNPKQLACKACLGRDNAPKTESKAGKETNPENIKYYCIKCNYKFLRKKGMEVTICPYCGSSGTLTTKTDVDSLLKTSDSEVFEG